MKTSYSRAWGMQAFRTCIYDISTYISYRNDIIYPYIIDQIFGINYTQQSASSTPTSAPSTQECGEMEKKEWENREIDANLTIWTFNLRLKLLHLSLIRCMNGLSVKQIHRNWFTSRESEHSSCNGQENALQNAKGQLTNDKNPLFFPV